ncbi:hypothetical protein A2962_05265 [Candidatus Woesebacteria bacterium RIFCSPLOWO2_01_FULL_39_61]|uniref:Cell envelope-related transcriptional attenuator domain-containing protein n=1 Tax=Candidatus Woesebacteria bacterium RIFCSPHIGHO2_02_FULL_39_13 TaxID=1802505 RepID=A0A1F7Z5T1_9BACT|nr:MAG: hypothetical protein A2692_00860 [Candidatus Woesebacteria bacterium RIFCSPHIGHO2_01_FULL_39_95]OGM34927.1 MAG: hypothetical protein A3D01_06195 [Candidatus Woesebacteria bacterium RIFCSPHIGHO2_02_FULL_39_13]OGM38943.1 MAG: hypothetical protein A3E13_02085 [Candidatus Woesebacteria bacterium RIFCSPHIGHO2_12_FULL_40_20]OGM68046.1 MAG: hypothetical protein A2962_05265 [Candidatus Woesebacteria bacterium RIFCSPLOWO2_01_FULL_39_61]OGM74090.1 MAG: hypothetical protein A3H19_01415 [Candidatus
MKRKIYLGIFFLVLFLASTTLSYLWGIYKNIYVDSKALANSKVEAKVSVSPTPTPDPLGPKDILILGYGGPGHEGGLLTDTILIAHIRPRDNSITLISIPRDVAIYLPVTRDKSEYLKVNHAYAIGTDHKNYPDKPIEYLNEAGGGNLAKYAVNLITGLQIDYFVSVNFVGFTNIINTLGGISVNVPYTFEDKFYPLKGLENELCGKSEEEIKVLTATLSGEFLEKEFPCRYETIKYVKGVQVMDGETALKFVRSRHSEIGGGDFARAQRQQALIVALKNKLLSYKSIPKIISVINTASKNVLTDIDFKSGFDLLNDYGELKDLKIKTVTLTTDNVLEEVVVNRQYVLVPKGGQDNWEVIHQYIKENLN